MIALTEDMILGVKKIDDQHKDLVDRINGITSMGLKSASKEEVQNTIDLLGKYVIQHFKDEEELQRSCNYPKYEQHKEQHQAFILEFQNLKKEFETNGDSIAFAMNLNNTIVTWIVKHIKNSDAELGKFYRDWKKR